MVKLACGVQCTRMILFTLNILFLICGLSLVGAGIYVKVSKKFDIALSDDINTKIIGGDAIQWVGVAIITVGAFTVLLSGFGCLGSVFKNRVFLYLYALILGLLIITEILAVIATLYYRGQIRDSYDSGFREFFIETYSNNHTDLKLIIEDIEREFQCCGVYNVTDYYTRSFTVPASCHQDADIYKPIFVKGCARAVIKWIENELPIISGALGGILLLEIFGVISSIALGIAISHSSYDEIYS